MPLMRSHIKMSLPAHISCDTNEFWRRRADLRASSLMRRFQFWNLGPMMRMVKNFMGTCKH